MSIHKRIIRDFIIGFLISLVIKNVEASNNSIVLSEKELSLLLGESRPVTIEIREELLEKVVIDFFSQHGIVQVIPPSLEFDVGGPSVKKVSILATSPGYTDVILNSTSPNINAKDAFFKVTVQHSRPLEYISEVVGWMYFFAWSISFYPQIYTNFKRKSVVGLNFDYLSLNIVGFMLYSLFNVGLFFVKAIEDIYFEKHPRGMNPVVIQDVVFSLHAVFATFVTIVQCFIYERGNQRISTTARIILAVFVIVILVSIILAGTLVISWLDFLYYCSYIKLSITLIKYVPQAYMNYKRKSTIGWSIGNILLDFVGGILSMLQMCINAYNFDDWISLFGDPTKFGLGLFSVVFDVFFIVQHYVLYRTREGYIVIDGDNVSTPAAENAENEPPPEQTET